MRAGSVRWARAVVFVGSVLAGLAGCTPVGHRVHHDPARLRACEEVGSEARAALPVALEQDDPAPLLGLLDRWEDACGVNGSITRAGIVARVRLERFEPELLGAEDFEELYEDAFWSSWSWQRAREGLWRGPRWRPDPLNDPVLRALRAAAQRELAQSEPESEEWLHLVAAAGDGATLVRQLERERFAGTEFGRWYRERHGLLEDQGFATIALSFGVWRPSGALGVLGDHPAIGLRVGGGGSGWGNEFAFEGRFLSADEPYRASYDGREITTDHYSAYLLSNTTLRRLLRTRDWGLYAVAGIGWHALHVRPADDDDAEPEIDNAWQLDAGLELRHRFVGESFVSLELRRAFHDLDPPGGGDLSGGSWTLRFAVGRNGQLIPDDRRWEVLGIDPPVGP